MWGLDADAGSMHDARTSTALRQLADLGRDPDPPGWHWGIARAEVTGRLVLPAEARAARGATTGHRRLCAAAATGSPWCCAAPAPAP